MIEVLLSDKLKKIFDFKKVTFDSPGETVEQDCLFIDLETSRFQVKDGRVTGRVQGSAFVYVRREKMPIGHFAKCIANAPQADTKSFFFLDIDETNKSFKDLVTRSFGFIFFFDSQYDPEIGSITSINNQRVTE